MVLKCATYGFEMIESEFKWSDNFDYIAPCEASLVLILMSMFIYNIHSS